MDIKNFSYKDFLETENVSRETFSRLQEYVTLLYKWQKTINLVSSTTIKDVWNRHIIDSAQLFKFLSPQDQTVDAGSGAGFPGLVLSILGVKNMTLIESDSRKAAFLKEVVRATGAGAAVQAKRLEDIDISSFSVVTARAFAPLADLLTMLSATLCATNKLLLLKGKTYESEIENARKEWAFDYSVTPSITDDTGVILSIQNIRRLS